MSRQAQKLTRPAGPTEAPVGRASLATVARAAGVAVSTVSAILANRPYCYASADTRERVQATARRLRYRPNRMALALRGQRTRSIGLLIPSLTGCTVLSEKVDQLEIACNAQGYRLLVAMHREDPLAEAECLQELVAHCVDGIILQPAATSPGEAVRELLATGFPVVTMDSSYAFPTWDVAVDREAGGRLQVEHLWRRGCRHLAFLLSGGKHPLVQQRLAGYRRALAAVGSSMAAHLLIVRDTPDMWNEDHVEAGAELARQALQADRPFDGLVAGSDLVALGAIRELAAAGRRVPQHFAVVGFDDEAFLSMLPFPFATIRQPREVGRLAVEKLLAQIAGTPVIAGALAQSTILTPTLVLHGPGLDAASAGSAGRPARQAAREAARPPATRRATAQAESDQPRRPLDQNNAKRR